MMDQNIILPSKPAIVSESGFTGVYEVDGDNLSGFYVVGRYGYSAAVYGDVSVRK